MQVDWTDTESCVEMQCISAGEAFAYRRHVYMCLWSGTATPAKPNAVRLGTGDLRFFTLDTLVRPLDAKVVVL